MHLDYQSRPPVARIWNTKIVLHVVPGRNLVGQIPCLQTIIHHEYPSNVLTLFLIHLYTRHI